MPRASSRNRHLVPDLLAPGLDLVFCGTAPSPASFKARAYYANPGNAFWPTLHAVGLTPERLRARPLSRAAGAGHRAHRSQQDRVRLRPRAFRRRHGCRRRCTPSCAASGRPPSPSPASMPPRWRSASRRRPTAGRPSRSRARWPSCLPRRRAAPARSGHSSRGARRPPSSTERRQMRERAA